MHLKNFHSASGAQVADDGIPTLYTEPLTEYRAALDAAVLMDRSHEGRLLITGDDRIEVIHRISTNDLHGLAQGEGRATIFTNANARILDRALVYALTDERLLMIGGPGRGNALRSYLQRNIFFRDNARIEDAIATTFQFSLHGPHADRIIEALIPGVNTAEIAPLHGFHAKLGDVDTFVARRESYSGTHWLFFGAASEAVAVWETILKAGSPHGLVAAGSLTFNTLRIRAELPGVGRELSSEYIPLEVGLWDEISFKKGCYTGQEIIARMESRGRLARTLVHIGLAEFVNAPADLSYEGKRIGTLTSSVTAPDGEIFALGVVKMAAAASGSLLKAGEVEARVLARAGVQPAYITAEETEEAAATAETDTAQGAS